MNLAQLSLGWVLSRSLKIIPKRMQLNQKRIITLIGFMVTEVKIPGKTVFSIIWGKPYTQLRLWELFLTIKKCNSFISEEVKLNFLQENKKMKVLMVIRMILHHFVWVFQEKLQQLVKTVKNHSYLFGMLRQENKFVENDLQKDVGK